LSVVNISYINCIVLTDATLVGILSNAPIFGKFLKHIDYLYLHRHTLSASAKCIRM
jgi:hypothetical protein